MTFTPNRPTATEFLQVSQGLINTNFTSSDNTFGIEHYKFSDVTANKGFHNTVTQPLIIGAAHPTTTTNPIIYAMSSNGSSPFTLQFSRGTSNAVPTPITNLNSPSTPLTMSHGGGSLVFLNFNKISGVVIGTLYFANIGSPDFYDVELFYYNSVGPVLQTHTIVGSNPLVVFGISGTTYGCTNNTTNKDYNNCYWSMNFYRMGP